MYTDVSILKDGVNFGMVVRESHWFRGGLDVASFRYAL